MTDLTTEVWGRITTGIPTERRYCEFIDQWTGARHVRVTNPEFKSLNFFGRRLERGWVWRGPPSIPPVVWHQSAEDTAHDQ